MMSWGFYTVGKTNNKRVEQRLENRRVRYAISPLLQAEADFVYRLREKENLRREQEIMKDVPGWKVGESWLFSKRFMPRGVDPMSKTRS
jgi:NADH dehydrogenase (ubiquinone) 1 alpha subcomplex subunit 13